MDVLTFVGAFWISTWIMLLFRTWSIIARLIDTYQIVLAQRYKALHFCIYSFSLIFITPLLWQVAFNDEYRKRYVLAYVNALRKNK